MEKSSSQQAFKAAIIALTLCAVGIILMVIPFHAGLFFMQMVSGILFIISGGIAIAGIIFSIRSVREPNTVKKILALVINFTFAAFFISIIVANILDIKRAIT